MKNKTDGAAFWIVNRIHVSTSAVDVVREISGRMKREARFSRATRARRHEMLRASVALHLENRALHSDVIGGRI
jgi:hypothetical protein